jgi:hypothetical protein
MSNKNMEKEKYIPVGLTKKALDYLISCLEELSFSHSMDYTNTDVTHYHRELEENLKSIRRNQNEQS